VAQLLARHGMRHERRSRMQGSVQAGTQVLLLDTLGELLDVLPAARGVFVGGTIAPVGGHNVLEPAVVGTPVAFGPHTANVAEAAAALLDAGGAVQVRDASQLCAEWRRVLTHPTAALEMGRRGRALVEARAGVAEQTFEMLRPLLGPVVPPRSTSGGAA
jgi:3-deoxy-D-manno-octulosonic-acid transferase